MHGLLVLFYQPVVIYPFNRLIPTLLCVSSYIIRHVEWVWYIVTVLCCRLFVPPHSICWNLMPNLMVQETFRKWLGHEGRSLINGISTLIRRDPTELSNPFHVRLKWVEHHQWESRPSPDTKSASTIILASQPPAVWEINVTYKCLWFISYPVWGIFS